MAELDGLEQGARARVAPDLEEQDLDDLSGEVVGEVVESLSACGSQGLGSGEVVLVQEVREGR